MFINFSAISVHYSTQHKARELNVISGKNYWTAKVAVIFLNVFN